MSISDTRLPFSSQISSSQQGSAIDDQSCMELEMFLTPGEVDED
jgi:hypothetical protein